ncbi:MAG TPA: thiamine phosphate synthase [Candidatus Polarisedimenticolia bacterium]|nr:thiamine phosphate synthase [Candidatus Polarisedimenticolia bacterium]
MCYVTDRKSLGSASSAAGVLAMIRQAFAAGADWVQVREKDLPARELLALSRDAVAAAKSAAGRERAGEACLIVNDRLDVALAVDAAGVHLGGESLPAGEAVRWCRSGNAPAEFLIGVSCHSFEDAREAEAAGASYVFFGPIFETPSKKRFGPPQGIARLAEVCRGVRLPVIAIGGVNEANGVQCLGAGAAGVAAIRMFQAARNAASLAERIARLHRRR